MTSIVRAPRSTRQKKGGTLKRTLTGKFEEEEDDNGRLTQGDSDDDDDVDERSLDSKEGKSAVTHMANGIKPAAEANLNATAPHPPPVRAARANSADRVLRPNNLFRRHVDGEEQPMQVPLVWNAHASFALNIAAADACLHGGSLPVHGAVRRHRCSGDLANASPVTRPC